MLEGAAGSDREGQRVGYGDYIRLMSHTVKRSQALSVILPLPLTLTPTPNPNPR